MKVMSANLVLEHEDDPVIWRGPVLAGAIRQFWAEPYWEELDYLLVDMPPGTGDVPLNVFQSLPIEGVVIVSSPQDLVQMVVGKAANMAAMMDVPVYGLVENMAYFTCPHCGERVEPYGPSRLEETAKRYGIRALGQLPIDGGFATACDEGKAEEMLPDGLLPEAIAAITGA
jgi:Mrp family chromosome partitioning ATPase